MFATVMEATQKTPLAWVVTGSVPSVFCEQSTPVTLNWNLPSRTGWFRPAVFASPDDEPPPAADEDDGEDPPPLVVAITMITMRTRMASRMNRFFCRRAGWPCGTPSRPSLAPWRSWDL